jgi:hypothetical protein
MVLFRCSAARDEFFHHTEREERRRGKVAANVTNIVAGLEGLGKSGTS